MTTVNKKKNKLLYAIDQSIARVLAIVLNLIVRFTPNQWKQKKEYLAEHQQTLHNVVGLTGLNALGGVLILLTQVKLANVLGASIYGMFSYYVAIGEVGCMIVRYGRHKTMTRDLIQRPEKTPFLIVNTFLLSALNLVLFTATVLFFHKLLDAELSWAFFFLVVSPCLISMDFQPVYEALRLMSWHSIYNLLQKALFLSSIWFVIYIMGTPTLISIGIVMFVSWVLVLMVQFQEIMGTFSEKISSFISISNIQSLYRDNFVIALSCMFGVAFGPLIRMILNQYADSRSVGIYSAGMQIFLISQFVLHQVGRVGNPMMAEVGKENSSLQKRVLFVKRYIVTMLAATVPFALPMIVIPQIITNCFFIEEYSSLAEYLPILAIYLVIFGIGVVFTQFLISVRADKSYFAIYVSASIATVATSYLLIPSWGVMGAMISLCVPNGVACIAYALASLKYLRK